jgi:MFS family permease
MGLIFRDWGDNKKLVAKVVITAIFTIPFGLYVRSLGRPMFIFLLLIMVPLATTELGTDSWITPLMEPEMKELGLQAGWVLVYTSLIMMILRFFAGPIVHKLSPLGLLAASAAVAACGLVFLSKSTGVTILAAATLYGFGKTFFWPTMLGVVAERFPRGGALTLNITGGVGMLSVGVLGAAFLGNIQDKAIDRTLKQEQPDLHAQVVGEEKLSIFGAYLPIDETKATPDQVEVIKEVEGKAKKGALATVAIFPIIMFVCYLSLIIYFRSKGGYQAEVLAGHAAHDEEFTGGVPGPADA